ncbi:restriction endonuclease subunit S [Serratia marcescens]|nr:restriction endonuclease subunit S [Serratia marcescens]
MVPEGWTKTLLGNVMQFKNGLNFTKNDTGEAIKIVGVANFKDLNELHSTEDLDVVRIADKIRDEELLANGDLLFVRSNGNKELIGRCLYFPCVSERLSFSGFTIRGRAKKELVIPEYIAAVARSSFMKQQISKNGGGTNISNLSQKILNDIVISLPKIDEQKRITQVLSVWDKAIVTTKKLLANSQKQKKSLMQQLLTGRKRLSGFDEVWTNSNLKSIVNFSKGQQINRNTLISSGEFPVINGGVFPSGYTSQYNGLPNTITISEGGNSCGYVSFQKEHFWCGGHCYALTNLNVDVEFMYHLLKFNETKIMRLRVGSGLPNIQKKDLEAFTVYYPLNMHEQQKIANVLSVLDQEIEVLQQKLNHLKQEKKALMQQLLTGKRRVKVEAA